MTAPDPTAALLSLGSGRPEYVGARDTWTRHLAPALVDMEQARRDTIQKARKRTVRTGLMVLSFVVGSLLVFKGMVLPIALFFGVIAFVGLAGLAWIPLLSLKSQTKQLVVGAAAEAFGFDYDTLHPDVSGVSDWRSARGWMKQNIRKGKVRWGAGQDGPNTCPTPAFDVLKQANCLPSYDRKVFEDLVSGVRAGARFSLVECRMTEERGTEKDRRTVTTFQGLLVYIAYPEPFLGRTLISRQGWWKGLFRRDGLEKVDLVSRELEDQFDIFSNDQVEARALLSPDRMERLIALERHFKGGKLRGVFEDDHLTLALETKNQFEAGSIWKPLVDSARFASALEEMGLVCDLIDGFLTREWVRGRL